MRGGFLGWGARVPVSHLLRVTVAMVRPWRFPNSWGGCFFWGGPDGMGFFFYQRPMGRDATDARSLPARELIRGTVGMGMGTVSLIDMLVIGAVYNDLFFWGGKRDDGRSLICQKNILPRKPNERCLPACLPKPPLHMRQSPPVDFKGAE